MLFQIFNYLKLIFSKKKKNSEEGNSQTETHANLPPIGDWPYQGSSPAPQVLSTMLDGTIIEGDHVFYVSKLSDKVKLRVDNSYSNAMVISFWIGGGENPDRFPIVSHCGEQLCIKFEHLKANAPKPKKAPAAPKPKSGQYSSKTTKKQPEKNTEGPEKPKDSDRTRCQTAKIHYDTKNRALKAQSYYNFWHKRKHTNKRSYIYDCYLCDGWHLTSSNPNKRNFKPTGSW